MADGAHAVIAAVARSFASFDLDDRRYGLDGPLRWAGYAAARERASSRTGTAESVVCGRGVVGDHEVVLVAFDFRYLGGSVGTGTGARISHAFGVARSSGLPVVSLIATGGTRMQEGVLSLRQLQLITRQAVLLRDAGLPHIAVLRDPTTGGVWASLGAGADVVLAVRGAQVGFAGRRVRAAAYADDPAYLAESQFAAGQVDELVTESSLANRLADWLKHLVGDGVWPPAPGYPAYRSAPTVPPDPLDAPALKGPFGTPSALKGPFSASSAPKDAFGTPDAPKDAFGASGVPKDAFGAVEPAEVPRALGLSDSAVDGWAAVLRARAPERPRAEAYLADYFETRLAIRGDRAGGVDDGMLCGVGRRRGRSIAYAAQTGTANTPAGFRTASRLIRLADTLGLPVLTLVDTPGAAADPAAERGGLGPAIAELFATIAAARVPVTTLIIGEGGSGGALAMCSADRVWITPDAYFSVIAPELAAAILKRPQSEVHTLAGQLHLRPADLLALGVVQGIAHTVSAP